MRSHDAAGPDGRTVRWAGHRDRRRTSFVEAAVGVIGEVGPTASVEQIAAAAGVTRQVLYRQFDGRTDLDEAIVEHAAALVYERVMADLGDVDQITEALRRVLDGYLDFIDEYRSLYWFTRAHESERAESQAVGQVKDRLAQVAIAMAQEMLDERGLTAPVPLDTVFAVGLIGLVDATVSRWLAQPGTTSRSQLVDGLLLMLTGAIDAVIPPVT